MDLGIAEKLHYFRAQEAPSPMSWVSKKRGGERKTRNSYSLSISIAMFRSSGVTWTTPVGRWDVISYALLISKKPPFMINFRLPLAMRLQTMFSHHPSVSTSCQIWESDIWQVRAAYLPGLERPKYICSKAFPVDGIWPYASDNSYRRIRQNLLLSGARERRPTWHV